MKSEGKTRLTMLIRTLDSAECVMFVPFLFADAVSIRMHPEVGSPLDAVGTPRPGRLQWATEKFTQPSIYTTTPIG